MAVTLQQILAPEVITTILDSTPVHWLENIDGDLHRVRTACGSKSWHSLNGMALDPNRKAVHQVTCKECLLRM